MRDGWARLAKTDGDSIALCIWPKPRARVCNFLAIYLFALSCVQVPLFKTMKLTLYKYLYKTIHGLRSQGERAKETCN